MKVDSRNNLLFLTALILIITSFNKSYSQSFVPDSVFMLNSNMEYIEYSQFIDLDNDGDMDLLTQEYYDTINAHNFYYKYYTNNSIPGQFIFNLTDTIAIVPSTFSYGPSTFALQYSNVEFKDIDNDNDLDFFFQGK